MKLRSRPDVLRMMADIARRKGLQDLNRAELIRQLEAAATDIETMAEDLEMERQATRDLVFDLASIRPPKALT